MSKAHIIIVHTIAEDGLPQIPRNDALVGRVAFIFDGSIYCGWPLRATQGDPDEIEWEDSETARRFSDVKKWIELPVPGWEL